MMTTDCRKILPLRTVSRDLLSLDFGWFYHALALSGFCLSGRYQGAEGEALRSEALQHYNKGLSSVNQRLGDEKTRLSDGIILSILGIALHTTTPYQTCSRAPVSSQWCWEIGQSRLRIDNGPSDQWALHMKAVQTILNDRGGIATLDANMPMRHWLYL